MTDIVPNIRSLQVNAQLSGQCLNYVDQHLYQT